MKKVAVRILIRGIVQGVGFRPFLFREAAVRGLCGTLRNRGDHVEAILEGEAEALEQLLAELPNRAPSQARIEGIERFSAEVIGRKELVILSGDEDSVQSLGIPPDLGPCAKCWEEYRDPRSRRYLYPFLSCTDCGPRYTVARKLPYERQSTAFAPFPPCEDCAAEYSDPADRRFHAETIACARCGPRLELRSREGEALGIEGFAEIEAEVHRRLRQGEILGLKGMGGFQLIVDARNREAIERLRSRKQRPHQAFAVLARDLEAAARVCELSEEEVSDARGLVSQGAPIIILPRTSQAREGLPVELLAPDTETLGIMLPTTPLHQLLLGSAFPGAFDYLIATSGNSHGNPICVTEAQAFRELGTVADFFLTCNRSIEHRCDDSVWVSARRGERSFHQIWRLGRGAGPLRWKRKTQEAASPAILALGGELKNSMALGLGDQILLSPHIGNLFHYETHRYFEEMARVFPAWIGRKPELLAMDLHPQYGSSLWGRRFAEEIGIPFLEVQHHHAHAAACMEENGLTEALALVFDGTGLGTDGTLWGGELLRVDRRGFTRLGRLRPVLLTGGDSAVREPWKQGCVRLWDAEVDTAEVVELLARRGVERGEVEKFRKIWEKGLNSVPTSSMGRLFDSVAALLDKGAERRISYEGQAAIRLETLALRAGFGSGKTFESYSYTVKKEEALWAVDLRGVFVEMASELRGGRDTGEIAARFHETVFRVSRDWIRLAIAATGIGDVVLSGGVFQNQLLARRLATESFRLHEHLRVPPGDGGLAFGQAVIAMNGIQS